MIGSVYSILAGILLLMLASVIGANVRGMWRLVAVVCAVLLSWWLVVDILMFVGAQL
jgi:hypothetical protein